ncbi:MAG: hypothetical protein K0S32_1389 [Bacteroidetes bacterium]|jgi:hypothetical protein|nr:hypothetical protein [Bacteroidota bacterium]
MTTLKITGTEDTPDIVYSPEGNEFVISGRSLPEDVSNFYKPVFEWLEQLTSTHGNSLKFVFKLEYFNTASSKIILDILLKLEEIQAEGKNSFSIEWYYTDGDDDMVEAGEEYKELVEIPFNILAA